MPRDLRFSGECVLCLAFLCLANIARLSQIARTRALLCLPIYLMLPQGIAVVGRILSTTREPTMHKQPRQRTPRPIPSTPLPSLTSPPPTSRLRCGRFRPDNKLRLQRRPGGAEARGGVATDAGLQDPERSPRGSAPSPTGGRGQGRLRVRPAAASRADRQGNHE